MMGLLHEDLLKPCKTNLMGSLKVSGRRV